MFEAIAAAGRAASIAGVETESPGRVFALDGLRQPREKISDGIEGADIARRIRSGGAADAALVDHHDVADELGALERAVPARIVGGLALCPQQRRKQYIMDQRGFSRPAYAGDADETSQWN